MLSNKSDNLDIKKINYNYTDILFKENIIEIRNCIYNTENKNNYFKEEKINKIINNLDNENITKTEVIFDTIHCSFST